MKLSPALALSAALLATGTFSGAKEAKPSKAQAAAATEARALQECLFANPKRHRKNEDFASLPIGYEGNVLTAEATSALLNVELKDYSSRGNNRSFYDPGFTGKPSIEPEPRNAAEKRKLLAEYSGYVHELLRVCREELKQASRRDTAGNQ